MTSSFLGRFLVAAALLAPVAAHAADLAPMETAPIAPVAAPVVGGFYLGTLSAVTFNEDTHFRTAGDVRFGTDYDVGYYTAGRIGYGFAALVPAITPRIEVEVGYGQSDVDHQTVAGDRINGTDSFGDLHTWQGYVNGYVDFNTGALIGDNGFTAAFTPYIGGGIGAAYVDLHRQGISATGVVIDDSDTGFAYHLDAGVGVQLGKLGFTSALFADTTFDVGYRFTQAPGLSFEARDGSKRDSDYETHMVTFGFRKQF